MKQPKIAWAMIVKATDDEAAHLDKCLRSLKGHVDAFYIDLNHRAGEAVSQKVRQVAEKYGAEIYVSEWKDDFAGARNAVFGRVSKKYDFIGWCDADDTIENPEKIKEVIAIVSPRVDGIYAQYDYGHDEFGNVTITHWVCRIARNNGSFAWKSSLADGNITVHETLNETRSCQKVMNDEFKIVHHADEPRRLASLERNVRLLEGMLENQLANKSVDPRTLFYLGTHYFDAFRFERAKDLLQQYMQLSGWNEERSEALLYLSKIYKLEDKIGEAKHALLLAIGEFPQNPRPYIDLGELDYIEKRYEQSVEWLIMAVNKKRPKTTVVLTPMENSFRAYMLLAQSYVNIGGDGLAEAKNWNDKALKLRPLDPDAQSARDLIDKMIYVRDGLRAVMTLTKDLEEENTTDRIIPMLDALPESLKDSPVVTGTRQKYMKPTVWPKKSIALYVGAGPLSIWGPWSVNDGISGSEEAVIQLGKVMASRGWKVVVYATPGEHAGTYDGVEYRQYWEFNARDTFDVLVAWRSPWFFDISYKARKKYLWIHDVMDKDEFTKERVGAVDKVMFVSEYHASLYKGVVPDKKVFVTANGVDAELFTKYDDLERDPHRMVYTSAHERGLSVLYQIWPVVKKQVPDATLDVYYGWKGFDAINRNNPERMAWKMKMERQAKELDGVTDHGRVSHERVAKEMSSAGVFAYPCGFPEVFCISAIKAMAAGAYPVTTDYAVLKDYVKYGKKVHLESPQDIDQKFLDEYAKVLIAVLKDGKEQEKARQEMKDYARSNFSWQLAADGWEHEFGK